MFKHTENPDSIQRWKDRANPRQAALFERVKEFYSTWYSSNIMTLAVLGRGTNVYVRKRRKTKLVRFVRRYKYVSFAAIF